MIDIVKVKVLNKYMEATRDGSISALCELEEEINSVFTNKDGLNYFGDG